MVLCAKHWLSDLGLFFTLIKMCSFINYTINKSLGKRCFREVTSVTPADIVSLLFCFFWSLE